MDIRLLPLKLKHAHLLFQLIEESRDTIDPWLPSLRKLDSLDSLEYFLLSRMYMYDYPKTCVYEVWYQQNICGLIYIHSGDEQKQQVELSYWLGKVYTGQGIMTEACELLLHRLFGTTSIERVLIKTERANVKSMGIPNRLHFQKIAHAAYPQTGNHEAIETITFLMKKTTWLANNPYSSLFIHYPGLG